MFQNHLLTMYSGLEYGSSMLIILEGESLKVWNDNGKKKLILRYVTQVGAEYVDQYSLNKCMSVLGEEQEAQYTYR